MPGHVSSVDVARATRKVMKAIATGPTRVRLQYRAEDGTFPLVVALPNENIADVAERVRSVGGSANVAIAFAKNFRIISMTGVDVELNPEEHEDSLDVTHQMSMGMLLIQFDQRKRSNVHFRAHAQLSAPLETKALAYS